MNLFAIETAEDYNQLLAYGTASYGVGGTLKINGQQAANGSWFLNMNTTNVKPLYSGAVPTDITGPCLLYTGSSYTVRTKGVNCSHLSHSFCEYV